MKSSTLHRSTISKERVAALEELLKDDAMSYDSSPGVYVRSDKDRELDLLWQGCKINSKEERSPGVYLLIGFIAGAACMFLMTFILNMGKPTGEFFANLNLWEKNHAQVSEKQAQISIDPSSQTIVAGSGARTEKYEIQNGDSLAKIALRFYGSATPEKIQKIQTENNLINPNQISVGKELNIPLEN